MRLKVYAHRKKVDMQGKEVLVPKLSLAHKGILTGTHDTPMDAIINIIKSLFPIPLSKAQTEFLMIHLLAFNNLLECIDKDDLKTLVVNDYSYDINKCLVFENKTEFELDGVIHRFREPLYGEDFTDVLDVLNKLSLDGISYNEYPATVLKWAKFLLCTVKIDLKCGGVVKGLSGFIGA